MKQSKKLRPVQYNQGGGNFTGIRCSTEAKVDKDRAVIQIRGSGKRTQAKK